MLKTSLSFSLMSTALIVSTNSAMAAGLEKSTLWSGKWMALGGAASSSVSGSEALYFNPAAIASTKGDREITLAISPTFIEYAGPNVTANTNESSKRVAFPNALIYSHKLNEQWAFAAGTYTGGGTDVQYTDIERSGYSRKFNARTIMAIQELSAGLSYKINDQWKVGGAWRGAFVTADMASVIVSGTSTTNIELRDIKGSNMYGYRLGIQYMPNETWGLGMMYRNALGVTANGTTGGFIQAVNGAQFPIAETDMSVKTQFPQALSIGGHFLFSESLKMLGEYTWTQYGQNDKLDFEGTVRSAAGTAALPDQQLDWTDQQNVRLGLEYTGYAMPIRGGFVYTSQVTPEDRATTTLAPPGPGYTFALGTGMKCGENFELNGAIERTMIKGTVAAGKLAREGTYEANVNVVHLGATYGF